MERTEFQQMMAELKEQNERRRYDALRKKYAIAPDFTNMSLRDEIGVRYDLDELEQLKQKFGMTTDMPVDNSLAARMNKQEMKTTSAATTPQPQNDIWQNAPVAQHQNPLQQIIGAVSDMTTEYFKMKNHGYKYLDDYHHCKANYNAAARGTLGYNTAEYLGNKKEKFDFYWNQLYKGKSKQEAIADRKNDLGVNEIGRLRGISRLYDSAEDACADYRLKNPSFPKKYW